jgi:hypothetical protein
VSYFQPQLSGEKNKAEQQTWISKSKRRPTLTLKLQLREVVPVLKSSADDRISFYVRAARYRRLLYFVAHRVLGKPDAAVIAVENCLCSAARRVPGFDHEGAFRSWLVRLALDESLAILHGRRMPGIGMRRKPEESGPRYCPRDEMLPD